MNDLQREYVRKCGPGTSVTQAQGDPWIFVFVEDDENSGVWVDEAGEPRYGPAGA